MTGFHFGSYSLVVPPVADAFAAVAAAAGEGFVSVDPNVRPNVEPDLDIWRARPADYAALTDLLKISSEDFNFLYPQVTPASKAEQWLDAGVKLIVVTDGENEVTAWTRNGTIRVEPPVYEVVDTVGAGDSFQSALLVCLAKYGNPKTVVSSLDMEQLNGILSYAVKAASSTCSRRGANLPRAHEILDSGR